MSNRIFPGKKNCMPPALAFFYVIRPSKPLRYFPLKSNGFCAPFRFCGSIGIYRYSQVWKNGLFQQKGAICHRAFRPPMAVACQNSSGPVAANQIKSRAWLGAIANLMSRNKNRSLTIASSGPAKLRAFLCESLSLHFRTKRHTALRSADARR